MVMAHGMKAKPGDGGSPTGPTTAASAGGKTGIGSRRIFPPQFKLQVLDSYRRDADCKGNQRATARKYGIHRRQIQKWLQAEGNLRNSVVSAANNNNNCVLVNRNAVAPVQPVLSPAMAPASPASPADIASPARAHAHHMPMDLSVRRAATPSLPTPLSGDSGLSVAGASAQRTGRTQSVIVTPASSPPAHEVPEIWDLSKTRHQDKDQDQAPPEKPLFKPYLLDADDEKHPAATTAYYPGYAYATLYDAAADVGHVGYVFDESGVLQPAAYMRAGYTHHPHPQRNAYPLDFKLRAIDSYHRDEYCKGNQRAVAVKYNIHRRQVQKWLKQEEDLREREQHAT